MAARGTKTCASRFRGAETNEPHGEAAGSVHKSPVKIRKLKHDSKFVTQSFSHVRVSVVAAQIPAAAEASRKR